MVRDRMKEALAWADDLVERLMAGEVEDEELTRLFLGSALDPRFYEPSTNAATE